MGLMNIYKRRARNSPSFVKYTQLTNRWRGKAWFALYRNIPKTIQRKQLPVGDLNMWRKHYGEVLFGSIVKHIAKPYNDIGKDT